MAKAKPQDVHEQLEQARAAMAATGAALATAIEKCNAIQRAVNPNVGGDSPSVDRVTYWRLKGEQPRAEAARAEAEVRHEQASAEVRRLQEIERNLLRAEWTEARKPLIVAAVRATEAAVEAHEALARLDQEYHVASNNSWVDRAALPWLLPNDAGESLVATWVEALRAQGLL